MGWWGRGGEPAQPSWAVGCPVSRLPSLSSSRPHATWACFCPPRCPQPPGDCRQVSPQTHGSPGVAGRGEWGQVWRGKSWVVLGLWAAGGQGSEGWASPGCQQQQSQDRVQSMTCHRDQLHGTGLSGGSPGLAGSSNQPLHGQQRKGRQPPRGRKGCFRKRRT